jgi:hypothetical protein
VCVRGGDESVQPAGFGQHVVLNPDEELRVREGPAAVQTARPAEVGGRQVHGQSVDQLREVVGKRVRAVLGVCVDNQRHGEVVPRRVPPQCVEAGTEPRRRTERDDGEADPHAGVERYEHGSGRYREASRGGCVRSSG